MWLLRFSQFKHRVCHVFTHVIRVGLVFLLASILVFPVSYTPLTTRHVVDTSVETLWAVPFASEFALGELFVRPASAYGAGHRGIDFITAPGTHVRAPAPGTVHFVGVVAEKPVITIRVDADTLYTFEPVVSGLSKGQTVSKYDVLGMTATGGHCLHTCAHLGVRVQGEYVNPLRFFGGKPQLLPLGSSH